MSLLHNDWKKGESYSASDASEPDSGRRIRSGTRVGAGIVMGALAAAGLARYNTDLEFAESVLDGVRATKETIRSVFASRKGSFDKLTAVGFTLDRSEVINPDAEVVMFPVKDIAHISGSEVSSVRKIAATLGEAVKVLLVLRQENDEIVHEHSALLLSYNYTRALKDQYDVLNASDFSGDSDYRRVAVRSLPDKISQTQSDLHDARSVLWDAHHSVEFLQLAESIPMRSVSTANLEEYLLQKISMNNTEASMRAGVDRPVFLLIMDETERSLPLPMNHNRTIVHSSEIQKQ